MCYDYEVQDDFQEACFDADESALHLLDPIVGLHSSVSYDDVNSVRRYLSLLEPSQTSTIVRRGTAHGEPIGYNDSWPLLRAAERGFLGCARLLLEGGSPVDVPLELGGDIRSEEYYMTTPLMAAAHNFDNEMVEVLLLHGANPCARNADGASACCLADARLETDESVRAFGEDGRRTIELLEAAEQRYDEYGYNPAACNCPWHHAESDAEDLEDPSTDEDDGAGSDEDDVEYDPNRSDPTRSDREVGKLDELSLLSEFLDDVKRLHPEQKPGVAPSRIGSDRIGAKPLQGHCFAHGAGFVEAEQVGELEGIRLLLIASDGFRLLLIAPDAFSHVDRIWSHLIASDRICDCFRWLRTLLPGHRWLRTLLSQVGHEDELKELSFQVSSSTRTHTPLPLLCTYSAPIPPILNLTL